jgi:signal transduction histidine kinase
LNVIWLTIRAIFQTVPERSAALDEDLAFLQDNALQIKDMLEQLSDYCRLMEGNAPPSVVEFDPRRFLSDFLEDRRERAGADASPLLLELGEDCPSEVALDQARVRLALKHALDNAITAAGGTPVRVRSGGGPDRWIVELIVDKAPPAHVVSMPIRPDAFERLAGSAAERRGLDLAIAARISELLGGSTRLEIEPARRSTVVLEWPQRLANG